MTTREHQASSWATGLVIGNYLLLRELARGGMGEIWLALDRPGGQVERLVVLKRVLQVSESDPQHISMFLDEARIAALLSHANVVQVYTLGEFQGSYYLVMEYLAGESLGAVVRAAANEVGTLSHGQVVRIVLGVAKGLGYAHRRKGLDGQALNIVHRDISPQNVLITYDGQVKVLDFGIALARGRSTRTETGLVRGKIAYIAPEQTLGIPAGPTADVFSLGVVLWELLAGRRLHQPLDDLSILRTLSLATSPLPDVRETAPEVDAQLAAIVTRCLARDPKDRFSDGLNLALALEEWLHQHPSRDSLEVLMQRLFKERIAQLPALHRELAVTKASHQAQLPSLASAATHLDHAPTKTSQGVLPPPKKRNVGLVLGAAAAVGVGLVAAVVAFVGSGSPTPTAPAQSAVVVAQPVAPVTPVAEVPREVDAGVPAPVSVVTPRPKLQAMARLSIDTDPWTKVMLGKRVLGETPLIDVAVPAGALRLRLINDHEGVDTVVDLQLKPGEAVTKQYRLK